LIETVALAAIGRSPFTLAAGREVALPRAVVTSNMAATRPDFAAYQHAADYAPRMAKLKPIVLAGLPSGTMVFGGGRFVTLCDGRPLAEQLPSDIDSWERLRAITDVARLTLEVDGETLLVGRYGVGTWGHWIGELLAKVALAERWFPGRFKFVLPAFVLNSATPGSIWRSIVETLEAFGVGLDRVFGLAPDCHYRFASLFAVSPVWSDYAMHPRAAKLLRDRLAAVAAGPHKRIAIVRRAEAERRLVNAEEIHGVLRSRGFAVMETGSLSFLEQVRVFRGADAVFGVLGSDLANLVFSPVGVKVIAVAPDMFGDRFFSALIQERTGVMAEVRGPIVEAAPVEHKSSFWIDPQAVRAAFDALGTG
jgi:hypothetical protein